MDKLPPFHGRPDRVRRLPSHKPPSLKRNILVASKVYHKGEVSPFVLLTSEQMEKMKAKLSKESVNVCFNKGTERAFSGKFWNNHEKGTYHCIVCGTPLFSSDTKFESGTGWPSFFQPVSKEGIKEETDRHWGMARTEVMCSNCGVHLGHVFEDGPKPTGLRYCINSGALEFRKA